MGLTISVILVSYPFKNVDDGQPCYLFRCSLLGVHLSNTDTELTEKQEIPKCNVYYQIILYTLHKPTLRGYKGSTLPFTQSKLCQNSPYPKVPSS